MNEQKKMGTSRTAVETLLGEFARTTDGILCLAELREKLASGRQLRIKFGADVTAAFLHLGHAVNLWMMRRLQEEGHRVIFLIGDFTTRIGDPTGRSCTRKQLSREDMERNAEAFIRQISRVLITDDPRVFEVRRNSEWFDRMPSGDFLSLLSRVTHARLVSRDMFRKRIEEGADIHMHEMIYPVLQGWDSVELASDLTIVGSDQLFNEMMGRFFQEKEGRSPQVIITTRITPGLDGVVKQSKSLGNFIALTDSAREMFGKAMTLPDRLIPDWMRVYTSLPEPVIGELERELFPGADIPGMNPRDAKLILAEALVARYHGQEAGREETAWFLSTFSGRSFPEAAPRKPVRLSPEQTGLSLLELVCLLAPERSRGDLRRLILQGGVTIDGSRAGDPSSFLELGPGKELRIRLGKKVFCRAVRAG